MKILVTGGAGYIGGFMVKALLERGHEVVIADKLEKNKGDGIDKQAILVKGNLLDHDFVANLFSNNKFDAVMHFAGLISMGESMQNPYIYFENNIFGSLNVIEEMQRRGLNNFIFSSSAGVYGNPKKVPIPEDHPKNPTNPYGESKLEVERMLAWYNKIYNLNYAVLRYFNACGAALDGSLGENHNPESHIIPNAINALLNNREFNLYGTDYNTPDGTCIRDYVHVLDLVQAHILALEKLQKELGAYIYNVGTGKGHSNKEIIDMIKKVSGEDLKVKVDQRRPGDADILVADPAKIQGELGFAPKYSDLETIIKTAWMWHKNNSKINTALVGQNSK